MPNDRRHTGVKDSHTIVNPTDVVESTSSPVQHILRFVDNTRRFVSEIEVYEALKHAFPAWQSRPKENDGHE